MDKKNKLVSNIALKEVNRLNQFNQNINLTMMPIIETMNRLDKIKVPFMVSNSILNEKVFKSIKEQNQVVEKIIKNLTPTINQVNSFSDYLGISKSIEALNNSVFKSLSLLEKDKLSYLEFGFPSIAIDNISKLCESYNSILSQSLIGKSIENPMISNYIDLQNRLIPKIEYLNIEKMSVLQNFYTGIATDVFNFQSNTFLSFEDVGVIEERALKEDVDATIETNLYSKIAQSISYAYKYDNAVVEPKEKFEITIVSDIMNNGKQIVESIVGVNKLSKLKGDCIFKPTIEMMNLCINLPFLIVDSEDNFKDIIDWLYKAMWENRTRIKPIIEVSRFEFINNLRRYFFHDLEHGDKKKSNAKYILVGDFFYLVIGKSYPSNSKEWQQVQFHIYKEVNIILEELKRQV
jgi:tetrahydromethanopterin S-methyltransferase subunit B